MNLRLSRFYRTSSELSWGRNNTGMEEERELTAAIIREKGLNLETLGYSLNESFEDNTREVIQEIDASARWRFGLWGLKSDGKIEYDPSGLTGWEVSGSVRRYHRLGITSTLDITYKAEPGESEIKPVLEEAIKLKESWAIRMSAGYLFSMMTNRSTISEAPVFKIMIEWHHG